MWWTRVCVCMCRARRLQGCVPAAAAWSVAAHCASCTGLCTACVCVCAVCFRDNFISMCLRVARPVVALAYEPPACGRVSTGPSLGVRVRVSRAWMPGASRHPAKLPCCPAHWRLACTEGGQPCTSKHRLACAAPRCVVHSAQRLQVLRGVSLLPSKASMARCLALRITISCWPATWVAYCFCSDTKPWAAGQAAAVVCVCVPS
jgi:hypothetical protein